jgi:signal transduction histidine kinase
MSLRRKLLWMLFGFVIVPIRLAAAVATVSAYRIAERRAQEELESSLDTLVEIITEDLEGQQAALDLHARDLTVYFRRAADLAIPSDPNTIRMFMKPGASPPRVEVQHLILESGKPTAEVSGRGYYTTLPLRDLPQIYSRLISGHGDQSEGSPVFTGFHSTGAVLAIFAMVPGFHGHSNRYMVTEYAVFEYLEEILRRPGVQALESVLVAAMHPDTDSWRILYHPDPTSLALPIREIDYPENVDSHLAGFLGPNRTESPAGSNPIPNPARSGDSFFVAKIHPQTGWLVGASISLSPRLEPLRRNTRSAVILFGFLVLLVTSGIFYATRGVGRAVKEIAGTTAAIAAGDFSRTLSLRRSDEFGVIADRINQMGRELEISSESRAIARISAQLLHDLKGVGSQLNLLLYNLRENEDDPEFRAECFSLMQDLVDQVETITLQLRRGGEGRPPALGRVNLDEVVSDLLRTPMVASREHLAVEVDLRSDTPILTDRELVAEILQNLMSNAVEAMNGKGKLGIRSGRIATGTGASKDGPTHFVEVVDSGPGMSRDFIEKDLFRPFVTTKEKGIGLGMYTVREILTRLDGRIRIDSRKGKGTTVRVEMGHRETSNS